MAKNGQNLAFGQKKGRRPLQDQISAILAEKSGFFKKPEIKYASASVWGAKFGSSSQNRTQSLAYGENSQPSGLDQSKIEAKFSPLYQGFKIA